MEGVPKFKKYVRGGVARVTWFDGFCNVFVWLRVTWRTLWADWEPEVPVRDRELQELSEFAGERAASEVDTWLPQQRLRLRDDDWVVLSTADQHRSVLWILLFTSADDFW